MLNKIKYICGVSLLAVTFVSCHSSQYQSGLENMVEPLPYDRLVVRTIETIEQCEAINQYVYEPDRYFNKRYASFESSCKYIWDAAQVMSDMTLTDREMAGVSIFNGVRREHYHPVYKTDDGLEYTGGIPATTLMVTLERDDVDRINEGLMTVLNFDKNK